MGIIAFLIACFCKAFKADLVNGVVPASQLPSYVDDIVEVTINTDAEPYSETFLKTADGTAVITPETGKIYLVISSGTYYHDRLRWSGTQYSTVAYGIVPDIQHWG